MMLFAVQWKDEVGLGDLLTGLGLLATSIGLVFAARQLQLGAREQRAQFLIDLTERYFADDAVRKFYYRLDYPQLEPRFVFDPDRFIGTDEERWLDQLLYTFDVIGRVVSMGALSREEALIFAFQASRVINNAEVDKYLKWLNDQYRSLDRPTPAHGDAINLVQTLSVK